MTAPPEHDCVRREALGLIKDALNWCPVNDHGFRIRPPA